MTDLEKAARMALEALEYYQHRKIEWDYSDDAAITAIREALAEQPAKQGCMRCNTPKKCALYGCSPLTWPAEKPAQQKPVGYVYSVHGERTKNACIESDVPNGTPLYTYPQSKPWVGLTEKEKREARNLVSYSPLVMTMSEWTEAVQDATEAKLKEKNT